MFRFGKRSKENLVGIHPDLLKVVRRALELSEIDFCITEGLRTKKRQAALVESGASKTLNSRHITGHAIDFAAYIAGKVVWNTAPYKNIAEAFFKASKELKIPIVWGGNWKSFKDYCHVELDRKQYP